MSSSIRPLFAGVTVRSWQLAFVILVLLVSVVGMVASGRVGPERAASTMLRLPPPPTEVPLSAPVQPTVDSTEVLWLARAIYSETKQPHEQELVAWVIRNRVETSYRGENTYRGVVLDPWQFSAFNRNSPKRRYYSTLSASSDPAGFQIALDIAHRVANAPDDVRPFDLSTRHFYSARSMVGRRTPHWARNMRPVDLDRRVDPDRFRFYAGVM